MYEPAFPPRSVPIRVRKNIPTSWLEIILREGRNRQVRKMTAAVGHPTVRLIRKSITFLSLDGLQPGTYREMTAGEIKKLNDLISDPKQKHGSLFLGKLFEKVKKNPDALPNAGVREAIEPPAMGSGK